MFIDIHTYVRIYILTTICTAGYVQFGALIAAKRPLVMGLVCSVLEIWPCSSVRKSRQKSKDTIE